MLYCLLTPNEDLYIHTLTKIKKIRTQADVSALQLRLNLAMPLPLHAAPSNFLKISTGNPSAIA